MTEQRSLLDDVTEEPAAVECKACNCVSGHKLVKIHEGQSQRLDCGWCGRTLGFPLWYGEHETLRGKR